MNQLFNKIKTTLSSHIKLSTINNCIICCSGGPDSVFLAHAIKEITNNHHHLVYFDHMLRPNETKEEKELINLLGKTLNYTVHIVPLKISKKNQAHYRTQRLQELESLSKQVETNIIFLGHHLNDHIETFLMQALKGGTTELKGINIKTSINNLHLYHPLLSIEKKDILKWLELNEISYKVDSSNLETHYSRNKIRALLPNLLSIQNTSLHHLNESIQYIQKLQNNTSELSKLKQNIIDIENQKVILKSTLKTITDLPEYLLKCYIESTLNEFINKDRLKILINGLLGTRLKSLELDHHIIEMDYKWISIKEKKQAKSRSVKLKNNSIINCNYGSFCITTFQTNQSSNLYRLCIDKALLNTLKVTTINQIPLPISNKKRLLRKYDISPIQQDFWPIISNQTDILWIPNGYNANISGNTMITFQTIQAKTINFEK